MQYVAGLIFSSVLALFSMFLSGLEIVKSTVNFSPLIIAIIIGIIVGNTIKIPEILKPGINFSLKKILRVAIIFLGFRVSLSIDKSSIYTHLYLGLRDYGYNMDL